MDQGKHGYYIEYIQYPYPYFIQTFRYLHTVHGLGVGADAKPGR